MNEYQLEIEARPQPDIMERILRITRHRGFGLKSMQLDTIETSQNLMIRLTVVSDRCIALLSTQLDKLIDVTRVEEMVDSQQKKRA